MNLVVETKELLKHFGEINAVNGVELAVREGEIFGLIGSSCLHCVAPSLSRGVERNDDRLESKHSACSPDLIRPRYRREYESSSNI